MMSNQSLVLRNKSIAYTIKSAYVYVCGCMLFVSYGTWQMNWSLFEKANMVV